MSWFSSLFELVTDGDLLLLLFDRMLRSSWLVIRFVVPKVKGHADEGMVLGLSGS